MYVRGTHIEEYDGEKTPADAAIADCAITPSDVGPIEYAFKPKVIYIFLKYNL